MNNLVRLDSGGLNVCASTLDSLPYEDKIITKVIKDLKSKDLTKIKESTLGLLFERLIREEERKSFGQFYTPQEIVNYMLDFLNIKSDSKVLDPTCGCGVFLVTAYNYLKPKNPDAIKNLFGVDLNDSATKITRINLWLRTNQNSNSLDILEKNIKTGNSIVENKCVDKAAFDWNSEFPDVINDGGFDYIIGNPPYVTLKNKRDYDISESFFSQIINGSANAASLVVAKSYELLKEGGIMAFVLPKTFVRVNAYSKLRKFLLNNSKILHILDIGTHFKDVRGEQIILFIQKTNNMRQIRNNKTLVKMLNNENEFYVPQKNFLKYNAFLMFEDSEYYKLIEKIRGTPLEEIAHIFRGISISPNSEIISKSKGKYKVPIIKGNDISKFFHSNRFFVEIGKMKNNSSKLELLSNKKIILQNIFSSEAGIISSIDKQGDLTFDTVSNIVLKNKLYEVEYIQGLLNSKLINFYLMYVVFNKSKLTMHVDRVYLGKVPIKKVSKKKQNKVVNIIKKITPDNLKEKLSELDKEVYTLYGVTEREQNKIDFALRQIMSKRSLW